MKKIRLNVADLDATEILSRDQLKAIFGGSTGSSGSSSSDLNDSKDDSKCSNFCTSSSDCGGKCPHCNDMPNWNKKSCQS